MSKRQSNNSLFQDYIHPDVRHTQHSNVTPGLRPFTRLRSLGRQSEQLIYTYTILCYQDLIIQLENQKAELDVAEMNAPPQVDQVSEFAEEMATLSQQYELSAGKIKRVKQKMAKRLTKFVVFMEIYEEVEIWLVEIKKVVYDLSPVSGDCDKAKEQLAELRVSR